MLIGGSYASRRVWVKAECMNEGMMHGDEAGGTPAGGFATTRWTLVVRAGGETSAVSEQALADLCRIYWFPLYAYIRRRGRSREDAEDLTQGFLAHFLAAGSLRGVAADRGRFRAFLLAALKHYLANAWDRAGRIKRGGGIVHVSWDWSEAEARYGAETGQPATPDEAYDRAWAVALLERVIVRLREECVAAGKGAWFEAAKGFLMMGSASVPYAKAAGDLGMEEGALRVAVHRLRRRYREMLREELSSTLADGSLVEEELRALRAALGA